jgi:hypothetical protein
MPMALLLMADLRKRDIVTKVRTLKTGETVGGIPFTRGPLAHLLRNRFYIGDVRSGPRRRHARRVVSAAPDARTSFGLTGTRTESLPLAVSVSGKRDFGAREKCAGTTCRQ